MKLFQLKYLGVLCAALFFTAKTVQADPQGYSQENQFRREEALLAKEAKQAASRALWAKKGNEVRDPQPEQYAQEYYDEANSYAYMERMRMQNMPSIEEENILIEESEDPNQVLKIKDLDFCHLLELEIPDVLRKGKQNTIGLNISPQKLASLLNGKGELQDINVETNLVVEESEVKVIGSGQLLLSTNEKRLNQWLWEVKPNKAAKLKMKLMVYAFQTGQGRELICVKDQEIQSNGSSSEDLLGIATDQENWKWLLGTLLVPFIVQRKNLFGFFGKMFRGNENKSA